ncbi:hypothetical protein BJF78_32900 [Pseudonocardia sp. CNS-139]|nr:hypothetical protein BJF78_32900 [Pseudonocardia sp. CNS-139]
MPRSTRIVVAITVPLAAAAGLAGNWVTADMPDWLADPVVRWLLLGVLVLASVVVALLVERNPTVGPGEKPRFNAPTGSLTPPAPDHVALRGRERETRRLRELVARPRGRFAVIAGAGGMGKTALARTVADAARRDGASRCGCGGARWSS